MKNLLNDSEILKSSTIKEYAAKDVIVREGDTEAGWYILMKGRVGVFKGEKKVAEFEKRGVVFGELSSILETPRTASLIALEPTNVIHFKASLDHMLSRYPEIAKSIMISLAERLAKTTDDLIAAQADDPETEENK